MGVIFLVFERHLKTQQANVQFMDESGILVSGWDIVYLCEHGVLILAMLVTFPTAVPSQWVPRL